MSNQEKQYFKIPDNFRSVEMRPKESHMLAILARMDTVPTDLRDELHLALDQINAQEPVREVVQIFLGESSANEVSEKAHDLYAWLMLWADKRDKLQAVTVES